MAKKFFYNKVYNTKRTIINAIIIGVCVIGVIICFIVVSSFEAEDHSAKTGNISIKNEVSVEVNEEFENDIFFSKIENFDIEDIQVNYELDYDISKVGKYNITIVIDNKEYKTILNVIDTKMPELTLKDLEISNNKIYTAKDFVENCIDNSKQECKISFYDKGIDEEGNSVDYSKYTEAGTYQIKIAAQDESGNQVVKDATLKIGNPKNENNPGNQGGNTTPTTCKYGDNKYDTNNYLIAVDITTNKCAVSLDLYKNEEMTKDINKLMDAETKSIKKDVEALNLTGTLALNRKVTAVINTSGNGIVGYELKMTITNTNKGKSETVVEYKLDSNGKRVFITNPHNLAK